MKTKGQLSLAAIISLAIGFIVLTSVFAPMIATVILNNPPSDPNANSLMMFLIPAMFGMIIVVAFMYATGRKPPGLWSE